MDNTTKEIFYICGGVLLLIAGLITAISLANYFENEQRHRCYTINQSRPTMELLALCKGIK